MTTFLKIAALSAAAVIAVSCVRIRVSADSRKFGVQTASGNNVSRTFRFSPGYDNIVVKTYADIKFVQDSACYAEVSAPENVMDKFVFDVSDGVLTIDMDSKVRMARMDMILHSPVPEKFEIAGAGDLDAASLSSDRPLSLEIRGAGDIDISRLSAASLDILLKGAGDVDIDRIDCTDVNVEVNGAGDVDLGGQCVNGTFSIKGAGDIDIRRLKISGERVCKVSGAGNIRK